jgi:hypothetical protein
MIVVRKDSPRLDFPGKLAADRQKRALQTVEKLWVRKWCALR